jgi:hypothetical protein
MVGCVTERRPPTRATLTKAAAALRKLLVAIEEGDWTSLPLAKSPSSDAFRERWRVGMRPWGGVW